jgi:hypothetical protein
MDRTYSVSVDAKAFDGGDCCRSLDGIVLTTRRSFLTLSDSLEKIALGRGAAMKGRTIQ